MKACKRSEIIKINPAFHAVFFGKHRLCRCDYERKFNRAVDAFSNEAIANLALYPYNCEINSKREPLRAYIIKLLLFIGLKPNNKMFPIVAHIIELLAFSPKLTISDIINDFGNADPVAFNRAIERVFNVYDLDLIDRVKYITQTDPYTSKDIIYDLSVYIRLRCSYRNV